MFAGICREGEIRGMEGKENWNSLLLRNEFSTHIAEETQAEHNMLHNYDCFFIDKWNGTEIWMINSVNHNSFNFKCLLFFLCSVLYGAELWGLKQAVTHVLEVSTLFSEK